MLRVECFMDEVSQLHQFLSPYPPEVQDLALRSRDLLRERLWPVSEIFWDATQAVCLGFTFTHSTADNFFNLAVYAKHVTLIFPTGATLADPEGRLRGEGTRVRNMRLTSIEMFDDPYVWSLIGESAERGKRPPTPVEPIIIVKVMNGPKKRPQ